VAELLQITVNGVLRSLDTPPLRRLIDVLRDDLGLKSVKEGCGEGECGACAVLVDGRAMASCLIAVGQMDGREITTLEGLATHPDTQRLQEAFLEHGGTQCGFCAPGLVVGATDLLRQGLGDDPATLREALSGHLCRCTGYAKIIDAVANAAREDE
jgi:aerobic carbon-monoxide dehydrogenase small subunit